jgi:hypothetical protein
MVRVLKAVVGVIVVVYAVNFANSFLGGGRTVEEPREIGSDRITHPAPSCASAKRPSCHTGTHATVAIEMASLRSR